MMITFYFKFQIMIVLSFDALAKSPEGKTTKDLTMLVCPTNLVRIEKSSFHIIIYLSLIDPLAKHPFGNAANEITDPLCPFSTFLIVPSFIFHTIIGQNLLHHNM